MRKNIIFLLLLLPIISCSGSPSLRNTLDDADMLKERVRLYCEAKQKFDWDTVRSLVAPDIRDGLTDYFERLKKRKKMIDLVNCTMEEAKIEGEKAEVKTNLTVKYTNPLIPSLPMQEYEMIDIWVKKDGLWYILIDIPSLSALMQKFGLQKGGDQ